MKNENWKTVRLCDVCEKGSSNIAQNEIAENNGNYPIYGAAGFIKNIDFYKQDKPYIGIVKDGAGVGRVSVHPAKSSLIGTMQYIFPNENVDITFLAEFLKFQNLGRFFTGATIPHIYFKDYQNISLKLPPLTEQKHIAAVLDKCTEVIAKHREMLEKYDTLIKSRFIEMFGDIELAPQKKDWTELKDITKIFTGTTPSTADEENWNGEILWITPAEMTSDSFMIYDTQRKITEKGRSSKSLDIMPIGTVLLSTRAPIGKTGIVGSPMTCNQGFKNFLCNPDKLNSIYLYTLLRNNTVFLNSKGSGTTFKEVSKSVVEKIKIPVPPLALQEKFATFVRAVDAEKEKAQKSLDKAETLYKALMQAYFGA